MAQKIRYECTPFADSLLRRCESALNYAVVSNDCGETYTSRKYHLDCEFKSFRSDIEVDNVSK